MPKLYVAIIHGIGDSQPGFSQPLKDGITRQFNHHVNQILSTSQDYSQELIFKEIVWEDILNDRQDLLERKLRSTLNPIRRQPGFWNRIWSWIVQGTNWLRTSFVAETFSDIIGYKDNEAGRLIRQRVSDNVDALSSGPQKEHLSIVAHSLGSIVISDWVHEQQGQLGFMHQRFHFSNFFTFGSSLAIFALRYGTQEFEDPARLEESFGRWVNVLDKDDPLAFSLKPLNAAYSQAVLEDKQIDSGIFGLAHVNYWSHNDMHNIVARKLAIDWIGLNNHLTAGQISPLYQHYDQNLGL